MCARAPFGPTTSALVIRAAPPPGKLTTRILPAALKWLATRPIALLMLVATGPIGRDPILVQIGFTRFALRRPEAARVVLDGASP